MKALVTGGTGFIGSHVVDALLAGGDGVRVFSRRAELPEPWRRRNAELFQGDLQDPASLGDAMEGVDVLYHVGEIRNTTRTAAERNVGAFKEAVHQVKRRGLQRIVFISSITAAGVPAQVPATEETETARVLEDHYTHYKITCEKELAESATGPDYVVLRLPPVYGPRSRYLGRFIRILERIGPLGVPFIGDGRNLAPLVHVRDAAAAICRAGTAPAATRQTLHVTDGVRHSWFDFLSAVAQALGKGLRIIPIPPLLLSLPAGLLDLGSVLFGVRADLADYVRYVSRDIHFDNTKAREHLGWEPDCTELLPAVDEMVRHYREAV